MRGQPAFDLTLYLVVGSDAVRGRSVLDVVAAAVRGGVTLVQLREKTMSDAEVVASARVLVDLLAPLGVPLIINDRVEVAIAAGAAGVHLGQDDLDAARARSLLGPDGIVGVSAGTTAEAAIVSAVCRITWASARSIRPRARPMPARPSALPALKHCRRACRCPWWPSAVSMPAMPPRWPPPGWRGWPWFQPFVVPTTRRKSPVPCARRSRRGEGFDFVNALFAFRLHFEFINNYNGRTRGCFA